MNKLPKLITSLAVLAFSATVVNAQNADTFQQNERMRSLNQVERTQYEEKAVPEFYEGESEDLGPQLLLLRKVQRKLWEVYVDFQAYRTTNATLAEIETKSNVFVGTVQAAYLLKPRKFEGGDVQTRIGVRYQVFNYGVLDGDDSPIEPGTTPVDTLDFTSKSAFADATWTRGNWRATVGLTYSTLNTAHGTRDNFYYEWVPAFSLGRLYQINDNWSSFVMFDTSYRDSTTLTLRGVGDDDIDRKYDNSLMVVFTRPFYDRWTFQPSLRAQRSDYIANNRGRVDHIFMASTTFNLQISDRLGARFFTSYDKRESSEAATADYNNWNIGAGLSGVYKF